MRQLGFSRGTSAAREKSSPGSIEPMSRDAATTGRQAVETL